LANGDSESCVSRAYYAMFFAAEAALLDEGVDASTHRGVITEFGKRFVQKGPLPGEMGRLLSTTMHKRQVSDDEPEPASRRTRPAASWMTLETSSTASRRCSPGEL
jgi:uncharacterized protein (UPF0332 family)